MGVLCRIGQPCQLGTSLLPISYIQIEISPIKFRGRFDGLYGSETNVSIPGSSFLVCKMSEFYT